MLGVLANFSSEMEQFVSKYGIWGWGSVVVVKLLTGAGGDVGDGSMGISERPTIFVAGNSGPSSSCPATLSGKHHVEQEWKIWRRRWGFDATHFIAFR